MSSSISLFVYSFKIIVLLGRGALSMFFTILSQENLYVVLVVFAEEDLLVLEEIDFSLQDLVWGENSWENPGEFK